MPSCRICSLYSGSGGNSVYIRVCGKNILIDAGKSARSLCHSLTLAGSDIKNIDAIFITHEHTDHIGALKVLCKKNDIPIHMTAPSADSLDPVTRASLGNRLVIHPPIYNVEIDGVSISSFPASHDSACCVGFRIEFVGDDGEHHAIGYATDTGCIGETMLSSLDGCESVILESNHDEDMLRFGPYPYSLKTRIASRFGHLSNGDCATLASKLAARGTKNILLAHLSRENNTPDRALSTVRAAIPDDSVNILIADPEEIVELV